MQCSVVAVTVAVAVVVVICRSSAVSFSVV